eukprot:s2330_g5.t1
MKIVMQMLLLSILVMVMRMVRMSRVKVVMHISAAASAYYFLRMAFAYRASEIKACGYRSQAWLRYTVPDLGDVQVRFLAGAAAGATATTLTYPLDLLRARMAAHQGTAAYDGYLRAVSQIVRAEGTLALWSGLKPTLLGIVPYSGISFSVFGTLKVYIKQAQGLQSQSDIGTFTRLGAGAFAGLVAQSITYPLDIVRRRSQVHPDQYRTVLGSMRTILQGEGVMALFKGLSMNWVKGPVAISISFVINDLLRAKIAKRSAPAATTNRFGECIISREAHTNAKTGQVKHGFVLGRGGRPLYGVKTELQEVPTSGWKAFEGQEPIPEILKFPSWSDCCQHGAWHFLQEAENAAKGGHWKVVLMMADRAFDCQTQARPKGRGDLRQGGSDWSQQLCDLLGTRAEALLHLGQYKRALIDACAAVHFVPAFEFSKAKVRGVTACLNLGASEAQAKLLMDEMCKRSDREFPGIQALEPLVDVFLARAKEEKLQPVTLEEEEDDDERVFYRVVDPEDCKLYSSTSYTSKVIGRREYNDVVRGQCLHKMGEWLELHVSEEFDDSTGHRRAYVPLFTDDPPDERDEVLEKMSAKEYPRHGRWEIMGLKIRPVGLKPPGDAEVPLDYSRWSDPEPPENLKVWPYIYKHGLAVACMVRRVSEEVIDSFVRYHWVTGWNHVFLYFDEPDDPSIRHAKSLEDYARSKNMAGAGLTVHRMDDDWWAKTRTTSRFFLRKQKNDFYEGVCKRQEHDREARKLIAADQAVLEAHEMGIDWFAFLDIDECIYVSCARCLRAFGIPT